MNLTNMKINRENASPNYDPKPIQVEFVILHYSAGNLERTIDLFSDANKKVSSHLVISVDGEIYELVKCWDGEAYRAWHAGESKWLDDYKTWKGFNDISIGIELINLNGNILPYSKEQYTALDKVISHLKTVYPALKSPERILGHEHIASWRGKCGPGLMFDWEHFFGLCYPDYKPPTRKKICPIVLKEALEKFLDFVPNEKTPKQDFWHALSFAIETSIRLIFENQKNNV